MKSQILLKLNYFFAIQQCKFTFYRKAQTNFKLKFSFHCLFMPIFIFQQFMAKFLNVYL